MKLRLRIENFQSIGNAEFLFDTGINGIIGHSNSGKSSSIRAIKAALLNPSGSKRYIKQGHNKSKVYISTDDKPEVEWERTAKESSYRIDGELYQKTGRTNAFQISGDNLNFVIDENDDIINIHDEWSRLFPFSRTDSEVFKLFEEIFAIADSAKIFQRMKSDGDGANKAITELKHNLESNEVKIQKTEEYLNSLDEEKIETKRLFLEEMVKVIASFDVDIQELYKLKDKFTKLKEVKTQDFDLSIAETYKRVEEDLKSIANYDKLKDAEITTREFDLNIYDKFTQADKDLEFVNKNLKLMKFSFTPQEYDLSIADKYQEILKDIQAVQACMQEYNKHETDLASAKAEEEQIQVQLDSIDLCPLCGNEFKNCKD